MRPLEPPAGRQVYALPFTPSETAIDANGHVNNVVYLVWAQELAIAHWESGASQEDLARCAWIVLRHEVDYRGELKLGDTARGRTWLSAEPEGPRFERFVRFDNAEGRMCAQVRTIWCLIDAATRRPKRIPDYMIDVFVNQPLP